MHLDLRFLIRHAKLKGGLKGVEDTIGLGRPPHLKGIKGLDAIRLWREWTINGELGALRLLTEYNLYDAINLRSVLEWTLWKVADLNTWSVERELLFQKGVNWNDYPAFFKRGTFVLRRAIDRRFTEAELAELPPRHAAKLDPDLVISRSEEVRPVEMPSFGKVLNRVGVLFDGEEPRVG